MMYSQNDPLLTNLISPASDRIDGAEPAREPVLEHVH